jgi:mono/diheme cytochrome c family protein
MRMAKPGSSKAPATTPWRLFLLGAALTLGGPLLAGCQPAAPASPSFEADVRPIYMSHCVRCHGAGGTLNNALAPVPDGGLLGPLISNVWLDQYGNSGACGATVDPNAPCHFGALTFATDTETVIHETGTVLTMPPPPAPRLNDWELKVVDAWVAEKPTPVCSNSANPDPTICPPDAGQ